jgi:phage tail-like protein
MRTAVTGLPTPHPLAGTLPEIYRDHSFTERFCGALDEVMSPVVSTLDNFSAYLDVALTPEDMLPWLAFWLGLPAELGELASRRREVLHAASRLHGWQGTRRGIEVAMEALTGYRTAVRENGGAQWSLEADAPFPGEPLPAMVVEVHVPEGEHPDEQRLDLLVSSLKPAHVVHRVEVVSA